MPTNKLTALSELLKNPSSPLAKLAPDADKQEDFANSIRCALPNTIKAHLVSANVRDDRLLIVASSAVWAARMRFYVSDILEYMAAIHTSDIKRVDILVRPEWCPKDSA